MITTAVITFRELFEAFLVVGIFLGISKKLGLKRDREIWAASISGIVITLLLAGTVYFLGDRMRNMLSEATTDLLAGFLMIFSGFFIAYVIFSLHSLMQKGRNAHIVKTGIELKQGLFEVSLFFTVLFLVLREGFEIILFTASSSLFSTFVENCIGLLLGALLSVLLGIVTLAVFEAFPARKVFKLTEYLIIIIGAGMIQRGASIVINNFWRINLSRVGDMGLRFLPDEDTAFGHLMQGLFGVDRDFSFARLTIMVLYISCIYLFFLRNRRVDADRLNGIVE